MRKLIVPVAISALLLVASTANAATYWGRTTCPPGSSVIYTGKKVAFARVCPSGCSPSYGSAPPTGGLMTECLKSVPPQAVRTGNYYTYVQPIYDCVVCAGGGQ